MADRPLAARSTRRTASPTAPGESLPELMSCKEAAALIDVHERYVRRLVEDGKLPAYRIGTRLKIARADLAGFLEAARIEVA